MIAKEFAIKSYLVVKQRPPSGAPVVQSFLIIGSKTLRILNSTRIKSRRMGKRLTGLHYYER